MPFTVVPVRDRALNRVLKRSAPFVVRAGTWLWRVGEPADACAYVRSGVVALVDSGGRVTELVGPSELGDLSALGELESRRAGARALADTRGALVEVSAALRALRRGRRTLPLLLDALAQETQRARQRAAGAGGWTAARRLAAVLLDLVERFGGAAQVLPGGVTHVVLAQLAGLHRSTVTTVLNDWLYRDLLAQEGRRLRVVERETLWRSATEGAE